ncbi:ATP-binding protein [Streptomyces sp. DT203]|uniref:ATP-binding protein n=1 Tax=Streptomyces sp. DT203 TaxID=3393424 RepID=UPI003CF492AB
MLKLGAGHIWAPEPHAERSFMNDRVVGGGVLRLSVWDTNPHIPAPFEWSAEAPAELVERGRGLYLVTLWADSWGAHPMCGGLPGQGGKLLWVECAAKADAYPLPDSR